MTAPPPPQPRDRANHQDPLDTDLFRALEDRIDELTAPPRWRWPRLVGWVLLCVALTAAVWTLAPQQLPVSLYKVSLVSLAAVAGYWLDRSLFPYARPHVLLLRCLDADPDPAWCLPFVGAMLRRAMLVSAAMLAMGLGA